MNLQEIDVTAFVGAIYTNNGSDRVRTIRQHRTRLFWGSALTCLVFTGDAGNMAHQPRWEYAGAIYNVINRGNSSLSQDSNLLDAIICLDYLDE